MPTEDNTIKQTAWRSPKWVLTILKQAALDNETTLQNIINNAVFDLMKKHGWITESQLKPLENIEALGYKPFGNKPLKGNKQGSKSLPER